MKNYFAEDISSKDHRWKLSLIFSAIIHFLMMVFIFFVPAHHKSRGAPFIARLITLDEIKQELASKPPISLSPKDAVKPRGQLDTTRHRAPQDISSRGPQKEAPTVRPHAVPSKNYREAPPDDAINVTSAPAAAREHNNREINLQRENTVAQQQTEKDTGSHNTPPLSLRDKFLPDDVVSKVVEQHAKKEDAKKQTSTIFDTRELKHHGYIMSLKAKIEAVWKYPYDASAKGIYGDLKIKFMIRKDGSLGDVELLRTSGHKSLDDAAIKALKDAEPFWPLPEEWDKDALIIDGYFVYSLYGTYLR